ncbi:MAG: DUF3105 domain-containing protein [Caldilineaceae bacterium]|nr:DUF3105 domain-containing protein [Caldilineaceae bacterium]
MAKAKSAAADTKGSRRNALRERAAKQRRTQQWMYIGVGAFFVLLIGFVVFLQIRKSLPVAGEDVLSSQGNIHIAFGSPSPVAYNSTPPTSGPHYDNLVAWGIYDEPQRYEHLVHNLEDGGVIVYYQCETACPEVVDQLKELVRPYIDRGDHVVLAPNNPTWSPNGGQPLHGDMGATIAVTAWQRILKLNHVDAEKINAFIEHYEGIDHHVAGIG